MCMPVELRFGNFCLAEGLSPFREAEVGGGDYAGAFIEFAGQAEEHRPPRRTERQVKLSAKKSL